MAKPVNDVSREAFQAAGVALAQLDRALQGYRDLAVELRGFSVRGPEVRGGETLVVIRAVADDGLRIVAFHSGYTLQDVIRGVEARLANGTLRWRADEFANNGQ